MLLELALSKSFSTYSLSEVNAVENIGLLAAYGIHLVTGRRAVLTELASAPGLSARALGAFRRAHAAVATVGALVGTVTTKIAVSDTCLTATASPTWVVPLSYFDSPSLLVRPTLLAENATDAKFYVALSLAYGRRSASLAPVSFQVRGGGGQTTPAELSVILQSGPGFVLCITDGDREWSGDSPGLVFQQVRAVLPQDTWFAAALDNGVRTIENLLKFDWISKTDFYVSNRGLVDDILRVQQLAPLELAPYGNLKTKNSACYYRTHPNKAARVAYVPELSVLESSSPCGSQCSKKCFSFGGLHSAVGPVADFVFDQPGMAARSINDSGHHAKLARMVYEFGICSPPLRA